MPGGYENIWPAWLLEKWIKEMAEANRVKVWQLTECDWYAGPEMEGCVLAYLGNDGDEEALDDFGEPLLMDEAAMARLTLSDPDGEYAERSFAVALQQFIDSDMEFPCMFASTEY